MKFNEDVEQGRHSLTRPSSLRILTWFAVAVLVVMTSSVTAAWAETDRPPEQVGGTVPPGHSPCHTGALVARPDIAGTMTSVPITIEPLANDKTVPEKDDSADKDKEEDKDKDKDKDKEEEQEHEQNEDRDKEEQEDEDDEDEKEFGVLSASTDLTLTAVYSPSHGTVTWAQDELSATVTYTPDAEFTGSDVFGYTVEDDCGRTANGRIVVVVFDDDMPSVPAIVTKPVGPGQEKRQDLGLPTKAIITIPAEVFGETNGDTDAHFFVATDLGKPDKALNKSPGPGKRFANVAFKLVEFRRDGEVESPLYQVPLILEIAFDLAEGEQPTLFYWDEEDQEWHSDGIQRLSYDPETGIATFAIYHLTEFALFGDSAAQEILYLPSLTTGGVTGN